MLVLCLATFTKYINIGIVTQNEIISCVLYTPVAAIFCYVITWPLKTLMSGNEFCLDENWPFMTSESSFELLGQISFKTWKDKMLRTLNCCSSKPIDLGWTTMNTMAIETATQNFLIGQVVMMDIYTDDDFVLAFVILYPLIILFISVSFKEKCGPLGSRFSFFRSGWTGFGPTFGPWIPE